MKKEKEKPNRLGDEAPTWKHLLIVILAVMVLIGMSWIMWFEWGWFH